MRWGRTALLIATLLAAPAARSVAAEAPCHATRVALVIGNAAYTDSDAPLREPIGSAREFADALQRMGFATTEAENLTQDRMRSVIEAFEQKVSSDAVAIVFFSGFGIQSGGHTYLIPVDAAVWNEQDIRNVGFNLDRILSDLSEHGARLRFVVVDGARRNPYERRFRPTGAQGLAAVNGTPGVLALYSSLPGTTFDESGGNTSPFVDALITAVSRPGAQAEEAFRRARADAARTFRGSQTPWVSSFLDEDVALGGGDCRAPHATTADATPPAPSPPAQKSPPARPALPAKVPARPVTPPPVATATEAPAPAQPQPQPTPPRPPASPPAETATVPAHVAEQTSVAVAPPTPPPPPPTPTPSPPPPPVAPASSDTAKPQPVAPAGPTRPTTAAEAPPPAPSPVQPPRPPEPAPVEATQRSPTPPQPQPAPQPQPRQEVAISVPPPPSVTEDPAASEPITEAARLKEIKDRLYDRGLDPGEPGSPEMRNAILSYEKEAALPLAEQPTVRLLSSLRSSPVPTPWAAITVARDFKRWGMSWHEDTRRAALAGARARCGSDECIAAVSFSGHHCGAFALSPSGWSITWRDDETRAREAALTICKQKGPTCEIIGAVCADGSGRSSAARTQPDNR